MVALYVIAHARVLDVIGCCYPHDNPAPSPVCACKLCKKLMLKWLQVAEKEDSMSADEVDEYSSDGSGHTSEGFLDPPTIAVPVGSNEDMAALLGGIAQLARGQAILLERLSFLDKIVGTVQFDMTWVRDDMQSVHQAMDRFADYVCDIQDAVGNVEKEKEQVSLDDSPRQAWKGKEPMVDFPRPPSASTSHGERQYGLNDVACRLEGGNYLPGSQTFVKNNVTNPNTVAVIETGRRLWGLERAPLPEMGSPQCQQTRVSVEKELLQEESQQIEMSCQSTELPTPVTARSMWTDFTTAVRDWPAATVAVSAAEEGWVNARKGRWELTEYGKENVDTCSAQMMEEHGTLNLNLMPEKEVIHEVTRGRGRAAAIVGTTGASKNANKGAWRGTARGRRPPAVQPRYHTSVRVVL